MSRYDLTDFEWRVIEPLLPNKPRGVPRVDDLWMLPSCATVMSSISRSYTPAFCHRTTGVFSSFFRSSAVWASAAIGTAERTVVNNADKSGCSSHSSPPDYSSLPDYFVLAMRRPEHDRQFVARSKPAVACALRFRLFRRAELWHREGSTASQASHQGGSMYRVGLPPMAPTFAEG